MSNLSPFSPAGNAFIITVGVANQQTPILLTGTANANVTSGMPTQIRFFNAGTSAVWATLSTTSGVAAVVPTPGTTTMGTPQPVLFIEPGVDLVFTIPCGFTPIPQAGGAAIPGFYLNTISAVAAQPLWCLLGEGA
jgi:hypothetical protein